MKYKIKYIALTIGLLSVITSFLFFGRQQGTYLLLLLSGLLVSSIFYLAILFSKDNIKSKLTWTLVIVVAITVQWLAEPILIKSSYLIYLNRNNKELTEVNNILKYKSGDISLLNDNLIDHRGLLTKTEKENLIKLKQKLDVNIISKTDNAIYFGLWRFLDVRLGITYKLESKFPNESFQQLKGNWYY
jgi:hypothetical protein